MEIGYPLLIIAENTRLYEQKLHQVVWIKLRECKRLFSTGETNKALNFLDTFIRDIHSKDLIRLLLDWAGQSSSENLLKLLLTTCEGQVESGLRLEILSAVIRFHSQEILRKASFTLSALRLPGSCKNGTLDSHDHCYKLILLLLSYDTDICSIIEASNCWSWLCHELKRSSLPPQLSARLLGQWKTKTSVNTHKSDFYFAVAKDLLDKEMNDALKATIIALKTFDSKETPSEEKIDLLHLLLKKLDEEGAIHEMESLLFQIEKCFPRLLLNNQAYWMSAAISNSTNTFKMGINTCKKGRSVSSTPGNHISS